jgi:hypothetical protein
MNRFTRAARREQDESFRLSVGQVALCAFFIAVFGVALALFPDHLLLILGLLTAVIGAGKLVHRQLHATENDELPPASAAFRALADPTRPLTASDPISAAPPRPAVSAEAEPRAGS